MATYQKLPKAGTRRRALYDMLMARPDEWIEFDPITLGYVDGPSSHGIGSDLRDLRQRYNLDIRTDRRRPGICYWRYVPEIKE